MSRTFYSLIMVILFLAVACVEPPETHVNHDQEALKLVWEIGYDAYVWGSYAAPTVFRDSLLIYSGDGGIHCVTVDSGRNKWTSSYLSAGFMHKAFVMDQAALFGFSGKDKVFSIQLEDGSTLWETEIDSGRTFGYHTALNEDSYFIGTSSRNKRKTIWRLNKVNGTIMDSIITAYMPWGLFTKQGRLFNSNGWYPDNSPYFIGNIVCYDLPDMDTSWVYSTIGGGISSGNIVEENNILYAGTVWGGSLGNEIVALNAETGTRLWRTETYGCYQIVLDGDVLYYAGGSSVNALDKNTGHVLWEAIIPTTDESSPLAYWDGYVYKAHGGTLFIFDATTGERVHYTYTFNGNTEYVYQVSTGAGKIFVQTSQHLYAFEPFNPEALSSNSGDAILQI